MLPGSVEEGATVPLFVTPDSQEEATAGGAVQPVPVLPARIANVSATLPVASASVDSSMLHPRVSAPQHHISERSNAARLPHPGRRR